METNIKQLSPVQYELDIRAARDTIDERIEGQLKKLRPAVQHKGFRPGRVPMGMVKKLHGKSVAYEVVDELIQEVYKSEVLDSPEHEVLGSPTITKLEYEPYGDLHAQVEFGVKPSFDLASFSGEKVTRLTHQVSDEEIDQEIERLRTRHATYESLDSPAGDADFVRVDLQELDRETDTPVIGSRREGVVFDLGSDDLDERVKEVLVGTKSGETVRFSISHGSHDHDHGHGGEHGHDGEHDHWYQATVKDVQRRTMPELDDDFASTVSEGRFETPDELRSDIEARLRENWDQALRDKLEDDIVRRVVDLHDFAIPPGVVDLYLDSQIEDVARRNDGKLPEGFDVAYFKEQNRAEAERMARWMLIRDKIILENEILVEEEDLDQAFNEMGGEEASADSMRAIVEQRYPDLLERMERRIENRKVFDWLFGQFAVEEEEWVDDKDAK